jgi:hypothetical protein
MVSVVLTAVSKSFTADAEERGGRKLNLWAIELMTR